MQKAAAYRTRHPDRAPFRAISGWLRRQGRTLPPTGCWYDTASQPECPRTGRGKSVAHGRLGCLQHALERLAKLVTVNRIGQREFDKRWEVAWKIPDIVPLLVRRKFNGEHPLPFLAHHRDRDSQLHLPALVRLHTANHVEQERREDIAARDRQVARRIL